MKRQSIRALKPSWISRQRSTNTHENKTNWCEFWDVHGSENSSRGLLGYDAVQSCGRIPTSERSMLPPSSGLWRHVVLWQDTNVSEVHAASIFWVVTPCSVVVGYQCFRVPRCRHLHNTKLHGVTTQKTSTWIKTNCLVELYSKKLLKQKVSYLERYHKLLEIRKGNEKLGKHNRYKNSSTLECHKHIK
jgi:hypothetical protein